MLIYLDANIVQYCADHDDFLFGDGEPPSGVPPNLMREIEAIRELIELEQLGNWEFANSEHLREELHGGQPTPNQLGVYRLLASSATCHAANPASVESYIKRLRGLPFKQDADREHVATALAMGASWFLTNDSNIIDATSGRIDTLRIMRPSESVSEISVGLYLK